MELRDIEIFLTLGEELHFGRTARRLRVSTARVSKSIAAQERRIGAVLFERTSRTVALSPIGRELFESLGAGYRQINSALDTARAAARGHTGVLTIGVLSAFSHLLAPITAKFRARHPGCEVSLREVLFSDPFGQLRSGECDIHLLWLPVREPDLTVGPVIHTEGRRLIVAADHPLARRETASLEDLGDYPVPTAGPEQPEYWEAAAVPLHTPSGRPIRRADPVVYTIEEYLTAIASGEVIALGYEHGPAVFPRPGLVYLPVPDAPDARWGLVWRTSAQTAMVRSYAEAAQEIHGRDN